MDPLLLLQTAGHISSHLEPVLAMVSSWSTEPINSFSRTLDEETLILWSGESGPAPLMRLGSDNLVVAVRLWLSTQRMPMQGEKPRGTAPPRRFLLRSGAEDWLPGIACMIRPIFQVPERSARISARRLL